MLLKTLRGDLECYMNSCLNPRSYQIIFSKLLGSPAFSLNHDEK